MNRSVDNRVANELLGRSPVRFYCEAHLVEVTSHDASDDSGSMCSPRAVDPTTSANNTVTVFRTSTNQKSKLADQCDLDKRSNPAM
jgi:hypothetical protein